MRLVFWLTIAAFIALSVAFLYQPKNERRGRFYGIRRRIRIVGYAYVAAILIRLLAYLFFRLDF